MIIRILTALVGIPLIFLVVYLGGLYWWAIVTLLGLLALAEIAAIYRKLDIDISLYLSFAAIVSFTTLTYYFSLPGLQVGIVANLLLTSFLLVIKFEKISVSQMAGYFFGICYIGILFSYLILLRNMEHGLKVLALTLILTWSNDTGAYFVGKFLGKHPFAGRVSPKKTWEGSLGGAIFTVIAAVAAFSWLKWGNGLYFIFLGLSVAFAAQTGDLVESALKRWAQVKDSGRLLPGHGGILDRFDSMLFVAPVIYYFLNLIIFG